jgi:N6-adenosine-specific RNA methylase IME4/truncated hemoglobin YjbI
MELVILPEIKQALFPLREEEFAALETSVLAEGIRDELIVWPNNGRLILVDGHNRYELAQKHGLSFKIQEKHFVNLEEVLAWIDSNQLARRNLTDEQRLLVLGRMYERRKKDQMQNLKQFSSGQIVHSEREGTAATAKAIAAVAGVNEKTVRRAAEFAKAVDKVKEVSPEAAEKILKGEVKDAVTFLPKLIQGAPEKISVVAEKITHGEARKLKEALRKIELEEQEEQIKAGTVETPTGFFDVIVVDPPWPYGTKYDPDGRRAANPYPEMSLEEIKAIQLPANDNCVLFLWTTHKFMRYSFEILDIWGFREVAIITWVKDRIGLGSWLRSQSEFCIMAVKGNPKVNLTNQSTVVFGPLREHSRKPDEFYALVETLCPGRKLDYFAREKRPGWEVFGCETEKFNVG